MSNIEEAIQNQMAAMTDEQLIAALAKLAEKRSRTTSKEARKAAYRKAAYEADGVTVKASWKAARKAAADKRKAKTNALIAFAIEKLGAEKVRELGFRVS